MENRANCRSRIRAAVITLLLCVSCSESGDRLVIFDASRGVVPAITAQDAEYETTGDGNAVEVFTNTAIRPRWPGVRFEAPGEPWDMSGFAELAVTAMNTGDSPVRLSCWVDSPVPYRIRIGGVDIIGELTAFMFHLEPGKSRELVVPLYTTPFRFSEDMEFIGMRDAPGPMLDARLDEVTAVVVHVDRPVSSHRFEILSIVARGSVPVRDAGSFFPMIDRFGQYIHRSWPGKTTGEDDLTAAREQEAVSLDTDRGPGSFNRYGGWADGPRLDATGFFRIEEYEGAWWLVDPEGRLFWSHGIDCVATWQATPISSREHYFAELPAADSPLGRFYSEGAAAASGYYRDHAPYRTFRFTSANLFRKYGDDWYDAFRETAHCRLRAWGMNTLGMWSENGVIMMRKTPYVGGINSGGRKIEGSEGAWGKFPDPFDPSFQRSIRDQFDRARDTAVGDPWCIGFFVDNEHSWGDEVSLAVAALKSPADQPAKQAFIDDLRRKYSDIAALNGQWGTGHESWRALLESTVPPDTEKAWDDLTAFYSRLAGEYFRVCLEEVRLAAPGQLYLGTRFADAMLNDRAVREAAKYCDVIGYNIYKTLPDGIVRDYGTPAIIGEFHMGALDRGLFHPGLVRAGSQEERAAMYEEYVRCALRDPMVVGTHWFQYFDEPTTGRSDGENYQIGFVDICDTPYPEITTTARRIGGTMYQYRLETAGSR